MTGKISVHKRTLSSLLLQPGSYRDGQTNPPNNGQYIWRTGRDCKPALSERLTHNLRPNLQIIHNVSKTNCSGICTNHTQRQKIDSAIKMFMHYNHLKQEADRNIIHKFISYLTGNTTPIHLEGNSANDYTRRVTAENCALLLHYAENNGNSVSTFRDNLSVSSSRINLNP